MTRALFLDRDGTLVVDAVYPRDPDAIVLLPGAAAALRALPADVALVIVSNQSGIARGLVTAAEAAAVERRVVERFAAEGVVFAGAYHCPHGPDDGCACRKPAPGLLLQAARAHGLDLARSIIVGDKVSDLEAGRAAGCRAGVRFAAAPSPSPSPNPSPFPSPDPFPSPSPDPFPSPSPNPSPNPFPSPSPGWSDEIAVGWPDAGRRIASLFASE